MVVLEREAEASDQLHLLPPLAEEALVVPVEGPLLALAPLAVAAEQRLVLLLAALATRLLLSAGKEVGRRRARLDSLLRGAPLAKQQGLLLSVVVVVAVAAAQLLALLPPAQRLAAAVAAAPRRSEAQHPLRLQPSASHPPLAPLLSRSNNSNQAQPSEPLSQARSGPLPRSQRHSAGQQTKPLPTPTQGRSTSPLPAWKKTSDLIGPYTAPRYLDQQNTSPIYSSLGQTPHRRNCACRH